MRLIKISILISSFLVAHDVSAQGALLDDGQSGGGLQTGMGVNSEGLFIHGGVVGTFSGRVDIGALVTGEIFDKYNYDATALGIWTEIYVLRENIPKKIPLSLSLSYQVSGTQSLNQSTFGASIYKRTGESSRSFIQPAATFFYTRNNDYPNNTATGFGVGISLAASIGKYALFSFTPSFVKIGNESSGGMTIGLMFSDTPKNNENSKSKFNF